MSRRLAALALFALSIEAGGPAFVAAQERPLPGAALAALGGTIAIISPPGRPLPKAGSVVWVPGVEAGDAEPGRPGMASRDKRFEPHVIAVPRGATVVFPNVDPIYHSVFSLSPGNAFDLGLYRKGAVRSVVLKKPGVVRLYCNIHPEMTGYILVVEGSAFAVTDADGAYRIAGIPPGRHAVQVWSEFGGETSAVLDFAPGRVTTWDLSLDGSQYRPLPHKNKRGQDYPPATQDVDRY